MKRLLKEDDTVIDEGPWKVGTNVQFVKALDRQNIQIEIRVRGDGYTLASGSSSTAAAVVAHNHGL